jgi:hypothetical protein
MKNIFEHNDISEMKVVDFEDTHIFFMDNFYKDPDAVLNYLLSTPPPIWKEWEKPSYNMIYFEDRRHQLINPDVSETLKTIGNLVNQVPTDENKVITNFTRFKDDKFNDFTNNYWWPHHDCGYNAIVYLNKYEEEHIGTHLYKELYRDPRFTSVPEHSRPWAPKKNWEILVTLKSKYNRFVMFDGKKYFHGMDISDKRFFGENYRINQVMFFKDEGDVDY